MTPDPALPGARAPVHHARFQFDYGSGAVLWLDDIEEWDIWGNPVDETLLPISDDLRHELARIAIWFDSSLNWDYPPDPGPWREDECVRFNQAAADALRRLRSELGPTWDITDNFRGIHEDPDLDRYLTDPHGFTRQAVAPDPSAPGWSSRRGYS